MTEKSISSRAQQILEALACQLENNPGQRITTAALAKEVGVSEAALYRHFPSKARMFEALIEFIEDTIFSLVNHILEEHSNAHDRCQQLLAVLLGFSAKNPGLSRILVGDALTGEHDRLRVRITQFYDRLETQLKQILREAESKNELPVGHPSTAIANLLLATAEGRMNQFVRSGFQQSPLERWEQQWALLSASLFPTNT
ncbi:Transcriptional regulator SlmA, TetR family [hydrothermal vent metagenome]|uniref:Transcriptional regulator SlmA, TetR family n=1 Tax=hydrothermal vent metagenome TaxID=652676 RepID=A0A3B1AYE9_9ZZZZ